MKKSLLLGLIITIAAPVQAQLFSREAIGGAALGGLAGGVIGHNSGRKTAEGAAIGAGAGLLLGSLVHNARDQHDYYRTQAPVPDAPVYYSAAPVYYRESRPNYAVTGAALGGIAGGIIGHNKGRQTAEGIAIGAGTGLLLGSVAERHARIHERPRYVAPTVVYQYPTPVYRVSVAPTATATIQQSPPQQPVTIINNYYYNSSGPMSGANSLFGR